MRLFWDSRNRWALAGLFALAVWVRGQGDPWDRVLSALAAGESTVAESGANDGRNALANRLSALREEILVRVAAEGLVLVGFPGEPGPSATLEDLRTEAKAMSNSLRLALDRRPGSAFHLGRVQLQVTDEAPPVPTGSLVDAGQMRMRNARVLADALDAVPGVSIQRIGPRNERGVYIRGFDARQVPLFIDGIPIYVPYDGYVDFDRFLVDDIAEIQVSKGFSTVLNGPNALGGALNVVSRQPAGPVDLDLGSGTASGNLASAFANVGSRWERFWVQGGFARLSSDHVPVSGDFRPVPLQPADARANSYQTDYRARIQVAYTPRDGDQYSFGFVEQRGEKGNPPYAGTEPLVRPRFWQWPQWDKRSFYFIGNKQISPDRSLRLRLFRDQFDNLLRSFDDASYATQTRPSSFNSTFDDDTWGGNIVYSQAVARIHTIKTSFFFKDDVHREGNIGQPTRTFRDQSWSWGLEDRIAITERLGGIVGISVDYLSTRNAQDFQNGQVLPFPRNNLLTVNPMAGLFYSINQSARLHATWARKTRLPTIKDRYSYRLGQAVPNPELLEEQVDHWEVGYQRLVGTRSSFEVNGFWSQTQNSTQRFFLQPNLFQLRNLGEGWNRGFEFAGRTSPVARVQLTTGYTYLSRVNRTDPTVIPIDTPRHKAYGSAVWQMAQPISIVADLGWEAGRWNQNEAGRFLRSSQFAAVGASAMVELTRQFELQAGARNLLDRYYFLVDGYPESGRSLFVNLRYRLRC